MRVGRCVGLYMPLSRLIVVQLPTSIQPLYTLPLPASPHPITQAAFHPSLPLILLHTSERTINVLRLRSEEEVSAKRARRKKREREKGKQKGEAAAGDMDGEESSEVAWQDRVQGWCNIRTNAKIKSFALSEADSGSFKSGVPVSFKLYERARALTEFSFWSPYLTTLSRPTPFPYRRGRSRNSPMGPLLNLQRLILSNLLDIAKISERFASLQMTRSLLVLRAAP